MSLGWAVISTGLHPDNKIAPAINATPEANLVGVYSRDLGQAEAFAQKHGAPAAYAYMDSLLQDSRVDAVFLCSPNFLHARHALQAAAAGKHVFSEKPMTTTLEDAVAMVLGCREKGLTLATGYHLRTHPGHILAREAIQQGAPWGIYRWPRVSGASACAEPRRRHPEPAAASGGRSRNLLVEPPR